MRTATFVLAALAAMAACTHGFAVKEAASSDYPFAVAPLGLDRQKASAIDEQIVGGRDAQAKEFPHQASMQVVMPGFLWWDAAPQHICGGSLIAEDLVLTAAHCVYGVPDEAKRVEVAVGLSNLANEGPGVQRFVVKTMVAHPRYQPHVNNGVGPWDIAVLKLSGKAKLSEYVKLALLPQAGAIPTGSATLSGWGSTSQNGDYPVYPDQLKTADFPIVEFNTCTAYVSRVDPNEPNPLDGDSNLCVGPIDKTGLSSCSGDSGGPLIQKSGDDAVVIGVVSWGLKNCASFPFPSVFTRTSAFNAWIEQQKQK